MAFDYISFDELNQYVAGDPSIGELWTGYTDDQKLKWHKWIHNQINQHPWKGEPLTSFVERQAFPRRYHVDDKRKYGYCGYVIIRFDSDPDADPCRDVIVPRQLIAESVVDQITSEDLTELVNLRNIGVQRVKTGPLETEFQDNAQGNNPWPSTGTPLPKPLWDAIGSLSTLSEDADYDRTFRIERG